mgnify:CR=1 FL=1
MEHQPQIYASSQRGYTLIELMVALVLGLLVSAAAIQLLLTSQATFSMQQGGSEVQESALSGMTLMIRNIRSANYGASQPVINDFTQTGGLVFTSAINNSTETHRAAAALPGTVNLQGIQISNSPVVEPLLTRGAGMALGDPYKNQWNGASNVTIVSGGSGVGRSAQLVIQYRAAQDMYDCEGNRISGPRMAVVKGVNGVDLPAQMVDGDVVVERYFLRQDTQLGNNETAAQALALACDAGTYNTLDLKLLSENKVPLTNFGDAGQVLINRVDHFDVRLGVEVAPNQLRYYTINEYLNIKPPVVSGRAAARPRVLSMQVAILTRAQGMSMSNVIEQNQTYQMLDQQVKLTTPDSSSTSRGYLRRVYSTTISLRNGRGE